MSVSPREALACLGAALRRRVHASSRARRHELFMRVARPRPGNSVLDVGVTDLSGEVAVNLLELAYPWPERITATAIEPLHASASDLERLAALAGWPPHAVARQRLLGLTSVLVLHSRRSR